MVVENAMVLAAGLGTRMRPITDRMPKPLVPIAGKPLIDYALDHLREVGCRQVAVNVHYFAEQMEAHLSAIDDLDIVISDERSELLNSGGGLVKGLKLLPVGPTFVMNADLFWVGEARGEPSNLARLASFYDPATMDMAMLVVRNEDTTGHNGKIDFSMDVDGRLRRYDGSGEGVIYAGAILLDSGLFADAPEGAFNLNIYFDRAIAAGRLYGLMLEGHWITAGTPDAIGPAENAVRRFGRSG
ncbi:nucleotidyltransferase family protein [Rhizobium alvei]|uniref:Nucleotidyltransferase family protein n=1 Tax=Rhizobium alvei TaxID=1132659 RepID=A0ABT8YLV7_9HYPH|nr:nucleotidyltransferase family protein [Rhizobium alvei]MDO6964693.1 nucleotidyltransferase family protein [Rhizobium alvei]